jgi:hypothetical protein
MFTEERALWLYRNYRWLEQVLPKRSVPAPIIDLSPKFFPQGFAATAASAEASFETVKRLMLLQEWPCRLVAETNEQAEFRQAMHRSGIYNAPLEAGALGTFSAGDEVVITYRRDLLSNPTAMVATFAHELCHYLLATVQSPPEDGWEHLEPLTDLAAVHEGFGLILTNAAFSFGQWADSQWQGWQASTQGYLNTAELGFALAIFCQRSGIPPEIVAPALKPNPREVFLDAIDYVADLEAN